MANQGHENPDQRLRQGAEAGESLAGPKPKSDEGAADSADPLAGNSSQGNSSQGNSGSGGPVSGDFGPADALADTQALAVDRGGRREGATPADATARDPSRGPEESPAGELVKKASQVDRIEMGRTQLEAGRGGPAAAPIQENSAQVNSAQVNSTSGNSEALKSPVEAAVRGGSFLGSRVSGSLPGDGDPAVEGDWEDEWDEEPGLADTVDAASTVDELVVYLDGYLDAEQRRRVEQRLLVDEEARGELAALQNSWDALDCLPAASCSADFTESTMKIVVQNELAAARTVNRAARRVLISLAVAAAAVVSMGTGYYVTQGWQTAEERRFLEDLSLIRDWEKYQVIGDFEFLLDLEKEGLFAQEVNHAEH